MQIVTDLKAFVSRLLALYERAKAVLSTDLDAFEADVVAAEQAIANAVTPPKSA